MYYLSQPIQGLLLKTSQLFSGRVISLLCFSNRHDIINLALEDTELLINLAAVRAGRIFQIPVLRQARHAFKTAHNTKKQSIKYVNN